MRAFLISIFFIQLGLASAVFAAPDKNTITDKNLQLAMLDLERLHQEEYQVKRKITVKNTAKKSVKQSRPLSANCTRWNAAQINQKARTYKKKINKYAKRYKVDTNLIKSVIAAESCFKRKALSHAGAQGLMQLIPATARRFGVTDSYNADQNIRGGVKYLRFLLDRYKGNLTKTLAAYNAGEGKVDKYKGIPPYKETKQYVKNVLRVYGRLSPKRVSAVYKPAGFRQKPGRHGWRYNRSIAPHLYKNPKTFGGKK